MSPRRPPVLAMVVLLLWAAGGAAVVPAQEEVVSLTVSVTTPSGDPVGDATLTARWDGGSRTRTTASNGRVFIDVPAGADVEISLRHADYVRNFPLLVEDASEREVSMTAYAKGSASVTVEDADGTVADASVVLRKGGQEVVNERTSDRGVVDSGTVEEGEYAVVVSKAGYFVVERTVEVEGDTDVTIPIERGTVTLEVNVTDDHFDPPRSVGQATVDVAESGSVTTQPTGIGRISVPVNAWATVSVEKEGYEPAETRVFVREEDTRVDVVVQRSPAISIDLLNERVVIGERVSLAVTDEYGEPVADAAVSVDGEEVGRTDESGQAVVRVESGGSHEVVVESGSLRATAQVEGVEEGAELTEPTDEEPTDSAGTETETELPGFGFVVALFALAAAGLAGVARRSLDR